MKPSSMNISSVDGLATKKLDCKGLGGATGTLGTRLAGNDSGGELRNLNRDSEALD